MSMKKWKDVEETLRAEGLKFGFAQIMGAVTDGQIACEKSAQGLSLDIDQARSWAIKHNAAKKKPKSAQGQLFDSTEQLRRIADAVERIEALLKA